MIKAKIDVGRARVLTLGFTFKEDCPDTRNTKVMDVSKLLRNGVGVICDVKSVIKKPLPETVKIWRL